MAISIASHNFGETVEVKAPLSNAKKLQRIAMIDREVQKLNKMRSQYEREFGNSHSATRGLFQAWYAILDEKAVLKASLLRSI